MLVTVLVNGKKSEDDFCFYKENAQKFFLYKLMAFASLLYAILAYERFHRYVLLLERRGQLYIQISTISDSSLLLLLGLSHRRFSTRVL